MKVSTRLGFLATLAGIGLWWWSLRLNPDNGWIGILCTLGNIMFFLAFEWFFSDF